MHIFITGGTRGIGRGLVKEFLKKGHNVSFTGTSETGVQKALSDLSGNFLGLICDVRNKTDVVDAAEKAVKQFRRIDIWINNAGVNQDNLFFKELSEENIKKVIDTNVTGMMLGTSVALNLMQKQGFGKIYNMEGLGSNNMMIPKTIVYGSSKRLLTFFSQACNKELKRYKNIFVGTLSPGMVYTDFIKHNIDEEDSKITKILANEVEEVTPYLVKKMLQGKQNIQWLKGYKIVWRFMISWLKK